MFPEFVLSEALTLAEAGTMVGRIPTRSIPIRPQPANVAFQDLERDLAEKTARRIGWLPSTVKSALAHTGGSSSRSMDGSRDLLNQVRCLEVRTSITLGFRRSAGMMSGPCASTMTWQRQVGKLGDAHRIADQLVALAERLTRSYPDQAAPYMLLSEGYVQKAKNAYRDDEAPVIERWERKAYAAAIHAETLEPQNEEAHSLVKERYARLVKLKADQ